MPIAEWRENDAAWFEQRMLFCDLCGRMIATRYLQSEIAGEARTFCSEGCAALYDDYWLPERGIGYRPAPDSDEVYGERMTQ